MKTLDELKAMSDKELNDLWGTAKFPFEVLSCGTCMTGHHVRYGACHRAAHGTLIERITAMSPHVFDIETIVNQQNIEELVAMRLYHDDQYAPEKRVGEQVAQSVQQAKEKVNG